MRFVLGVFAASVVMATASTVAAQPEPSPPESDDAILEIETVEIDVQGRTWGAALIDTTGPCDEVERVEDGSTVTVRSECPIPPGDGSVQVEVFTGFVVRAACGDDDLVTVANGGTVDYSLDADLRAACRFEITGKAPLDVIVATDSRMDPQDDFTAVLEGAGGPTVVDESCDPVATEPVDEVPELTIGTLFSCTLDAGSYALRHQPFVPGVEHTIQCGTDDPRLVEPVTVDASGAVIEVGADGVDECLVYFRGVDGRLVVTIAAVSGALDAAAWSVEVTRNGKPLGFVDNRDPGGRCGADGSCFTNDVVFGEYTVMLTGPAGAVSVNTGTGLGPAPSDRSVSVTVAPGAAASVMFVVGSELPATGRNSWPLVIGLLLIVVGTLLVRTTRRAS